MATITDDAIRLRLFLLSLRGLAYRWLTPLAPWTIKKWKDLGEKFFGHYFPLSKAAKIRHKFLAFKQEESKALFKSHERFKDLLQ